MVMPDQIEDDRSNKIKRNKLHAEAKTIALQYGIPTPPEKHCPKCGDVLIWDYVRARESDRDSNTGDHVYRILVRY